MSVRLNERSNGKLQVLRCSEELAKYTFKACNNTHLFPKNVKFTLVDRMINCTFDIMDNIVSANAITLNAESIEQRKHYQTLALCSIKRLQQYVKFSYDVLGTIDGSKAEYWTKLIMETKEKLRAWVYSDSERIKTL